jgi:hypothetical protein
MRIRNGFLPIVLAVVLAAAPAAVLAGGNESTEGQYDITGMWYGINSHGNDTISTIVRTGPDEYTSSMSFLSSPNPFNLGTSKVTGYVTVFRKAHQSTYDVTSLACHGDDNNFTPWYSGASYAVITSGTAVQTGPDTPIWNSYGKVSCNPCWPLAAPVCKTSTACTLPQNREPWDPFNDPDAVCGRSQFNPALNVSRRVPIDAPCTSPPAP